MSFTDDFIFSFSDIFYVDATSEETIQTDLGAITPGNVKRTLESLRWLASWLLVFDNADNVDLKLKKFFPSCSFGNILITTRNRELRHYTVKDADADVRGMDLKDATSLLLVQARAESDLKNNALAEAIVQVILIVLFNLFIFVGTFMLTYEPGTSLLCIGYCASWCFHSLPLIFKRVSRTLPT